MNVINTRSLVLPTVGRMSHLSLIKTVPQRHAERPVSQVILDPLKLPIDIIRWAGLFHAQSTRFQPQPQSDSCLPSHSRDHGTIGWGRTWSDTHPWWTGLSQKPVTLKSRACVWAWGWGGG